jgi:hypothetical protein
VYRRSLKRRGGEVGRLGTPAVVLWAVFALLLAAGASVASAAATEASLPDSRRYELVSPTAKNGVEVIPQTFKTHVRPDGNAVTFSALGGFADPEGSSTDFEYLSRRTGLAGTSGWSTHGINPLGRPVTLPAAVDGNIPTFVNGFTPDLSAAVYETWRPLVSPSNVADVSNLYRVTGLDGGSRTVQLLTDSVAPLPDTWFTLARGTFARRIQPQLAGVSSDLRHVVFESSLSLTPDTLPYPAGFCALGGLNCPTHLYDNADGVVRLVGRIPQAGDTACDDVAGPPCVAADSSQAALAATSVRFSSQLAVSQDGRRIYFQAPAALGSGPLYLREDGVRTELIATNGEFWTASADGARAFFTTNDSLLPTDTDSAPDLYMYDREAPAGSRLTLVSTGSAGIDGYVETVVGASADGHSVYFVCDGQLIAGEPASPILGLYLWRDGQLRFIGSFSDLDQAASNGPRNNWGFDSTANPSRITPDGQHLLFQTRDDAGFRDRGGFGGYDQAGHRELYLYDAATGRLACASCNPSGRPATADAVVTVRANAGTSHTTADAAQVLTDDGRRVFFNTAEALVPEDLNGTIDAYEYDAETGRVSLLSSGHSTAPSYVIDSSPSGDDAFIVTRDRLVGWDDDDLYDLYDARVGGGFPEPPPPTPACAGEACLPGAGASPAAASGVSNRFRGVGNRRAKLSRHRSCPHRRVLRTVRGKRRCVKRRARRHARRAGIRDERSGR